MSKKGLIQLQAHSVDSAPEKSREVLDKAQKGLGFIPNMYAYMANAPALLNGYAAAYNAFRESSFQPYEQEVVLLSIAYENACTYCVAAHSFVGDNMTKVPKEVTDAIRNGQPVPDAKLAALSTFTRALVKKRGNVTAQDVNAFLAVGYNEVQVLEVVAAVGAKTLSNYFNHIFGTPLDEVFKSRAWENEKAESIVS